MQAGGKDKKMTMQKNKDKKMKEEKRREGQQMAATRPQQQRQPPPASRPLRLFLDSANVDDWRRWFPTGCLYGFTTNPLILQRDGVPCTLEALAGLVSEARRLGARELQLQAWGSADDPAVLLACARRLAALDPALVTVKLPCTPAGLEAARALLLEGVPRAAAAAAAEGGGCDDGDSSSSSSSSDSEGGCGGPTTVLPARVTVTAVYSAQQALLAQALGADYAAPYVGRMADAAGSAAEAEAEVAAMARTARLPGPSPVPGGGFGAGSSSKEGGGGFGAGDGQMRVLVASLRDGAAMARLAAAGCDTFTFSPAVMEEVAAGVEATVGAALAFEEAARAGGGYEGEEGAQAAP
jgi:transaldolase